MYIFIIVSTIFIFYMFSFLPTNQAIEYIEYINECISDSDEEYEEKIESEFDILDSDEFKTEEITDKKLE